MNRELHSQCLHVVSNLRPIPVKMGLKNNFSLNNLCLNALKIDK